MIQLAGCGGFFFSSSNVAQNSGRSGCWIEKVVIELGYVLRTGTTTAAIMTGPSVVSEGLQQTGVGGL